MSTDYQIGIDTIILYTVNTSATIQSNSFITLPVLANSATTNSKKALNNGDFANCIGFFEKLTRGSYDSWIDGRAVAVQSIYYLSGKFSASVFFYNDTSSDFYVLNSSKFSMDFLYWVNR